MFSRFRNRTWLFGILFFSAAIMAASYQVFTGSAGNPYQGITDGERAQAAGASWNSQNPSTSISLGDAITAFYSDGWTQAFEVTAATQVNGVNRITGLTSVGGTLRRSDGGQNANYEDQSPACGGTYVSQGYYSTVRYADGETSETWVSTGYWYQSTC